MNKIDRGCVAGVGGWSAATPFGVGNGSSVVNQVPPPGTPVRLAPAEPHPSGARRTAPGPRRWVR